PALEERARRRWMIGVMVVSRKVVERVVQLADEVPAFEPTVVHERIRDGGMVGRRQVEGAAAIVRLAEDAGDVTSRGYSGVPGRGCARVRRRDGDPGQLHADQQDPGRYPGERPNSPSDITRHDYEQANRNEQGGEVVREGEDPHHPAPGVPLGDKCRQPEQTEDQRT